MTHTPRIALTALLGAALIGQAARAGDQAANLQKGTPDIQSAGSLAFGPDGVLFVADPQGAAIFAVATGESTPAPSKKALNVEKIDEKVAAALGTTAQKIRINDLAVSPATGTAYLSVARGTGPDAKPAIVKVDGSGKVEVVSTEEVPFAKATLPNAAKGVDRQGRSQAITDLAFVDGRVIVAGLSNEEFSSRLLAIPFPFVESGDGTSLEIYHGAHGRFETKSPIRTFVPYAINGEPHLMAAYTCTPLVKIPLAQLRPGAHVKGTTVAELGNRNNPLDMVVYAKGGKDYILLTNSARGVMKIPTEGVQDAESIKDPVGGGGTKGLPYETIGSLKDVEQLDGLDKDRAVILSRVDGALNLATIDLP